MASNIDNLNFKVILDDKDFNTRVEKDIELAKKLNVELSQLLQAKVKVNAISATEAASAKRASDILTKQATNQEKISQAKAKTAEAEEKVATQAAKTAKEFERAKTATSQTAVNVQRLATEQQRTAAATQNAAAATSRAALAQRRLRDYASQTTNTIRTQNRLMSELKGYALGYLSIHGATQLLSSLVRVTGEFELQKTTLAAILGDLNEAEQIITRIQGLAVESPFQFKELTTYAKQLSAFSVPAEELYETTKMLADVSAGLGVGMDRIVLAYGQVRSAAFLRGQEVRQFTEAGIPILDELAKQFTELEGRAVSTGEVFDKISDRLVPFEMVAKVFKDMTSEGGKFYNMQEVQAETLRGKISNLKDAYEVMLNEIGSGQSEKLKGAVDWARKLMLNYERTGKVLKELIVAYGIYKATIIALELATNSFSRANHKLISSLASVGKYLVTNPYAALAAAVTAVGFAFYKWATYQTEAEKIQERLAKSHKDYTESLSKEYAILNSLYAKLELYTEGTIEHDKAKAQLMRKYSTYIDQLREEGVEVNNLADIYVNLADKIRESMQVKFFDSATQGLDQAYKDAQDSASNKIARDIKAAEKRYGEFTEKDRLALNLYVMGGLDEEKAFKNMSEAARRYFTDYKVFLNDQRKSMKDATDAYLEGLDEISDAYQTFQKENEKPPIDLTKFAESVQNVLKSFGATEESKGIFSHLWADNKTEYYGYLKDLREGYEDIKQKIKDVGTTQKDNLPNLEKQKEAIESIAKALGVSLDKGDYGKGKSKAQIDLETQIDLVKKLQDAYDKLRPYVDDKTMKSTLSKFFPDAKQEWIDSLDFTTVLKSLADELEKYDKDAAERLRNAIGKTGIEGEIDRLKNLEKEYKETAKAAEDYFNTLRKWASEDFAIGGEGITFDLSKIMSDLREKTKKIDLKAQKTREMLSQIDLDSEEEIANVKAVYEKEFGAGAWEEFWNDYYVNGFDAIQSLADKQKEYEKKLAQERVNDLAVKYVKESYFTQGIEISDLGDKTLLQVRRIKEQLQDLMSEEPLKIPVEVENLLRTQGVDISNLKGVYLDEIYETFAEMGQPIDESTQSILNLIQQIQQAGLSTEKFGEVIKKVFSEDIKELTEEEGKILSEMIESYLGEMQSLFEAIGNFAEKIGNSKLQGAMNGIAQSMQILGNVADKLAKGDWIGAIISGVTSLAKVILDAVSAQEELNRAIKETRNEMMLLASQKAINEGVESIFGTDDYKKFTNAYDEAVKAHKQALEDIEKQNQEFTGRLKDNWGWGGILGSVATGAATGAGIGALAGGWFGGITIAAGAIFGGIAGLIAGITGAAATAMNDYAVTLQQMADEIGGDLINEQTGGFNSETLKKIKETYTDLDAESQEMLDKLIANAEVYENAITEVATYMTDIFGQCADEMADAFIDSFKKSGEAALDYGDIMDSVATSIAKSMIKSAIIQNVWDDEKSKQAAAMLASGDAGGAMQIVDEAMRAAQDLAPHIQELLKSLEPYLQMEEEKPENTLGSGIKGITEDTANLLASYLNAIRADVSYAKTLWERMDANTQSIAAALAGFSAPSLMEYQAQIAANTYNTSISTQNILIELRSVMGFGDEGRAIRILS